MKCRILNERFNLLSEIRHRVDKWNDVLSSLKWGFIRFSMTETFANNGVTR